MGLISKKLSDWFRGVLRGGLNAALAEEAAEIQLGLLDTHAKVSHKAIEVRRQVKQHADMGDDFERELMAALDESLRETIALGKTMLTPMSSEDREDLLTRPLSRSGGSPASLPPATSPAALMGPETKSSMQEPRSRRGRPKGSKNRPKEPNTNGSSHA